MLAQQAPVQPGTTLKHYRILSRLGDGGMGVVYRAEDTRLGRTVALKVLQDDLALDEERAARLEREARAASAISHPGIATLFDFDREGGTAFLTMEFVEGETLRQILSRGRLPSDRLLDCLTQVADALAAAHREGVTHRDLKPENVMASDSGYYKILDFGLARLDPRDKPDSGDQSSQDSPTQRATVSREASGEGKLIGTVAYMSPEQLQGKAVDARSDVFSFGTLLYELATGKQPFKRHNAIATFHAIVYEEPEALSSEQPEVPPGLERITARCLAKDPRDRYQEASSLALDLHALRRNIESGSRSFRLPEAFLQGSGRARSRRLTAVVLAAAAALSLAGWLLWPRPGPEKTTVGAAAFSSDLAPSPPLKNRIVVTYFSNRSGDPKIEWLSQGLPEMLTTDLARSEGLEVISTQRLYGYLAAAGGATSDPLDPNTAAQLARWLGAGVVVSGSIFQQGESYRFDMQAYDTTTGQVITADRVEGTDLLQMADRLAAGLRQGLKVASLDEQRIQDVTTSSSQALQAYSRGVKMYEEIRFAEASTVFRQSLALDPTFTLAKLRLGTSLLLSGDTEEGLRWVQQAKNESERMPAREQILAQAVYSCFGDKDYGEAEGHLNTLLELYPQNTEGYFWKAHSQASLSADRLGAIHTLHNAMKVDPNDRLIVAALVGRLSELDLADDAALILEDFLRRNPDISAAQLEQIRIPQEPAS
jgi:serine/threonine protein kinase/Flp pilus assembly protein TadD